MGNILEVLVRSKTAEILLALEEESLTFNRLAETAGNPTTATRRVKDLRKLKLVS